MLAKFSETVVEKYKTQIMSTVRWYTRTLPRYIASNETDDLASEAKMAFIDALKTWDPRKGDLWPYSYIRVKGAMQDYVRKRGSDPVSGVYDWITQSAYVYMVVNKDELSHEDIDHGLQLDDAMQGLTEQERTVILRYYKDDKTFKEIGVELELSESQTSRICKTATLKLKKILSKK